MGKFSYRHINFYVKRRQNFNFYQLKLTPNSNVNNCALSNSGTKLKMLELIVSISTQNAEQIATYVGKSLLIFRSISLKPTMVFPRIDISDLFCISRIKCRKRWQLCYRQC